MKMSLKFKAAAGAIALFLAATPVHAQVTAYTSSAAFAAAAPGTPLTEDFSSGYDTQSIANGSAFNGIVYNFTAGSNTNLATLQGGFISGTFGGFNGFTLAADQGNGSPEAFYTNDQITLTFPYWVLAAGVFIEALPDTGVYTLTLGTSTYTLDSAVVSPDYTDPNSVTYFFLGVVSSTPFTSITVGGQDSNSGPFIIAGVQSVPEPATMGVLASGVIGLGASRRRRNRGR